VTVVGGDASAPLDARWSFNITLIGDRFVDRRVADVGAPSR
jgi:hypothetical protein